jgi:hypothetical protein
MRNCTGDAERGRHGASGPCQVGFCRKPLSGKLFFRHLATVPTMKFSVWSLVVTGSPPSNPLYFQGAFATVRVT